MASISALGVGSGLDLTGLLDQLQAAERQKLQPIVKQRTQEQAKISAYGCLQTALNQFQDATAKLNDPKLFSSLTTNVRGEGLTASAGDEASAGNYEVKVLETAKAGSLATLGVPNSSDKLVGADGGSVTLEIGGQALETIQLAADATLADIRDAINAQSDSGVHASIINDGSENGYRLVLNSAETGEAASITGVTFDRVNLEQDPNGKVEGRDAKLEINNITITSPSNRVEGAIQGITLELDSTAVGKTNTIVVERDTESLKEAVQEFVSAYNEMKSTIGRLTNVTGDAETAGELVGDRTVRTIESRLSSNLIDPVVGGELTMMSQLGISLRPNGRLELDESKLDGVIAENPQALADFFTGDSEEAGLAGRIATTIEQLVGDEGAIKSSITSSETRISSLESRYERMELSIDRNIERYRRQFSQLDGMIASMNSMSDYLSQQFDMMNAQMGRK